MKESSHSHTTANEAGSLISGEIRKGEQLIKTEPIDGTPLSVIETDHGYAIKLGVHRVTEFKEHKQDVLEMVENKDWHLLLGIIGLTVELSKQAEILNKKHNG